MQIVSQTDHPYFLWDYNLTRPDVERILHGTNETEKLWMIGRILTHARFEDIWDYLTPSEIAEVFPGLKLRPELKTTWKQALNIWGYHV